VQAWLIDIYRNKNKLILWLKTRDESIRVEQEYTPRLYVEDTAQIRCLLRAKGVDFAPCVKQDCLYKKRSVLNVPLPCSEFERFIGWFERMTEHRVPIYNADLKPELQFLYEKNLRPFCTLDTDTLQIIDVEPIIPLDVATIKIIPSHQSCKDHIILLCCINPGPMA
jgi:hypothetical protein